MMLIARLTITDGAFSVNPGDVIYAFAGDECRGMAAPITTHHGTKFMAIGSDVGARENISFNVYILICPKMHIVADRLHLVVMG